MAETLRWYDEEAESSRWIKALAELRQRATREGYCYQHVQAITVAIDQYAEKALGNATTFLTSPMASAKRNAVPARVNERHPFPLGGQPLWLARLATHHRPGCQGGASAGSTPIHAGMSATGLLPVLAQPASKLEARMNTERPNFI
jgi:hypothetical protein